MATLSLSDTETLVMNAIWAAGGKAPARDISRQVSAITGCTNASVYTYIQRLIAKGAIVREDPGFLCRATIDKSDYRITELKEMVDLLFDGDPESLVAALVSSKQIAPEKLDALKALADSIE